MAYIALYRKYRPKTFDDVVGQDTIVRILKNSINTGKIGHAYIFSGTRGTGKTSVAKIFSKAVNCQNNKNGDLCLECDICKNLENNNTDIIEIDAASNNGVEEIREIRNNVTLMPSVCKYKVYIIDEVHMLSTSAFNALLKTLEEPPEHVIFILATTELNKIPSTVLSRCQKLDFKKIPPKILQKQLSYILEKENKNIPEEVLKLVAELGDGSFRDAINLIDQLLAYNKKNLTIEDVYNLVGDMPKETIFSLLKHTINYDIKSGLELINKLYEDGKNFYNISQRLEDLVKDIIINNNTHNYFSKSYEKELEEFSSLSIQDSIELSNNLFDLTNIMKKTSNQKTIFETYFIKNSLIFNKKEEQVEDAKEETKNEKKSSENVEKKLEQDREMINSKKILINNALALADRNLKIKFVEKYNILNDYISNIEYSSISNLLIKATPEVISNKYLIFSFKNNFEVVLFDKNTDIIQKLLKEIYNKKYEVVALNNIEWNAVKEKYKIDKNNGIKYEVIEEETKKKSAKKTTALEKEAENIFGDDIVDIE